MKRIKYLLSILLVVATVSSFFNILVYAETPTIQATDITVQNFFIADETQDGLSVSLPVKRWTYTSSIINGVVISGSTGRVSTNVETYGSYYSSKISVTSTLQRKSGSSWVTVKSFSGSGTGYCLFDGTATISSGQTYRVVTSGTVTYNGKAESISATSKIYYT